jgi:hypothetical protein
MPARASLWRIRFQNRERPGFASELLDPKSAVRARRAFSALLSSCLRQLLQIAMTAEKICALAKSFANI